MGRVRRLTGALTVAMTLAGTTALTGCAGSGTADPSADAPSPSSRPVTGGTVTTVRTATATSTIAGTTITASPPPPTSEPPAVPANCPYLTDDAVAQINGQHTGQTQIIDVKPHPICVFSRSDGGWLATVRIIKAGSPQQAVAAVDAAVPIDRSDPANRPPGWSGGAMVTDDRSIYAVSQGPIAVVAESNQLQTIKGRQMAIAAIASLGL